MSPMVSYENRVLRVHEHYTMHFPQLKGGAATGNEISGSSLKRKVEVMAHSNADQLLTDVDV